MYQPCTWYGGMYTDTTQVQGLESDLCALHDIFSSQHVFSITCYRTCPHYAVYMKTQRTNPKHKHMIQPCTHTRTRNAHTRTGDAPKNLTHPPASSSSLSSLESSSSSLPPPPPPIPAPKSLKLRLKALLPELMPPPDPPIPLSIPHSFFVGC